MNYINPFYIELQETIVGKYLNIIHTYIYIKQMNIISTSIRILQNVPVAETDVQTASALPRKCSDKDIFVAFFCYESNLAMSIFMYIRYYTVQKKRKQK